MTQDSHFSGSGTLTSTSTTTIPVPLFNTTTQGTDEQHVTKDKELTLTDTIAAVTIAVLAVVLVIALMLIVRTIRRRQRQERGQELHHIPTVSAGIMSANVGAYRGQSRNPSHHNTSVISWEPVSSTTATTSADIQASSGVSGVPSCC